MEKTKNGQGRNELVTGGRGGKQAQNTETTTDTDVLFDPIVFNGDNKISFLEFVRFLEDAHEDGKSPQMQAFENRYLCTFRAEVRAATVDKSPSDQIIDLDALLNLFRSLDQNADGVVSKDELLNIFKNRTVSEEQDEKPITIAEVDVLFAFLDSDGDGIISVVELYQYLESCGDRLNDSDSDTFVEDPISGGTDEEIKPRFFVSVVLCNTHNFFG